MLIGSYIGRQVRLDTLDEWLKELAPGALAHDVVLVWAASTETLDAVRASLEVLIAGDALAIACAGGQGQKMFDELLKGLQYRKSEPHTMTQMLEGNYTESVEGLFYGTWPCEERMGEWTGYWIVAEGDETAGGLLRAARGLIDSPTGQVESRRQRLEGE